MESVNNSRAELAPEQRKNPLPFRRRREDRKLPAKKAA